MNTNDNHLVSPEMFEKICTQDKKKYTEVPNSLTTAALLELAGRAETVVGKESTGSINTWAEKKRMTKRQKNKLSCP